MPRIDTDEWIDSHEASQILTTNSGHSVSDAYVRRLADSGRIRKKMLHERLSLYNRRDVESYRVQKRRQAKTKKAAEAFLDPEKLDIMAKVHAELLAKGWGDEDELRKNLTEKLAGQMDEEQKKLLASMTQEQLMAQLRAIVREELRVQFQHVADTGDIPNFDEE